MNNAYKIIALVTLMLFSQFSAANAVIASLAKCDADFFKTIKKNKDFNLVAILLNHPEIESKGNLSINIDHMSNSGIKANRFFINFTDFENYNQFSSIDIKDKAFFWGIESSQSFEEIVDILSNSVFLVKRGETYIANPMIRKGADGPWKFNISGNLGDRLPEQSAEKTFIVEKSQAKNTVKVMCALQGDITKQDLHYIGIN